MGARSASRAGRIQSLWSGYGEVVRVRLTGGPEPTVILKHVRPPPAAHPRKTRSYEVEGAWYTDWAPRCGPASRVPRCFAHWTDGSEVVFVLEDLDAAGFAGRKRLLGARELDRCLDWLASFHATFLGQEPTGLWEVGTYWHLGTRPDEYARMSDASLKREAPALDAELRGARFQTLVHGDAKAANFCFPSGDGPVAAVDFQYVGGGPGIRDVAYLLGAWTRTRDLEGRLARYFTTLRSALRAEHRGQARAIEAEWRGLYPVAERDFARFLDGWR